MILATDLQDRYTDTNSINLLRNSDSEKTFLTKELQEIGNTNIET